jgi:hypothetical protein
MTKFDTRVKAYFDGDANEPAGRLILDLLAWGQQQAAEAKAWKHANAMVPMTREQLALAIAPWLIPIDRGESINSVVRKLELSLGTLYCEHKTVDERVDAALAEMDPPVTDPSVTSKP